MTQGKITAYGYELSGLTVHGIGPDGIYGYGYVLLDGRTPQARRGEWRLLRSLPPDEVAELSAMLETLAPERASAVLADMAEFGATLAEVVSYYSPFWESGDWQSLRSAQCPEYRLRRV